MARPRGKKGRDDSPAATEQRRDAAKKSRPGRRAFTPSEERGRAECVRLGRSLCPRTMRLMARLVGITEKCVKRIEAEIRSNLPDFPKIVQLREQMLTPLDLVSFNRDLQGRFGQPTRTVQDVKHEGLSKTPLIILDSGEDEAWEGRTNGAAHAAPPDGD